LLKFDAKDAVTWEETLLLFLIYSVIAAVVLPNTIGTTKGASMNSVKTRAFEFYRISKRNLMF